MEQDDTWHGIGLSPDNSVIDGDPAPPPQQKGGGATSTIFGPFPLWRNGCMDQDATWFEGRHRSRRHCVKWGPSFPPQNGGTAPLPNFRHVYCGQTAVWIKMALGMEVDHGPRHIVLDGDSALLPKKGTEPPFSAHFGRPFVKRFALCYRTVGVCPVYNAGVLWPNGWMDQDETRRAGRFWPRPHCVRWRPSSPFPKGAQPDNSWPIYVVAKWLDGLRCHLVWR